MAAVKIVLIILTACYPVCVYFSIGVWDIRLLVAVLAGCATLRLILQTDAFSAVFASAAWLVFAASLALDSTVAAKTYPVLVNLFLLAVFAFSLIRPPSVVERLARLQTKSLPPQGVVYTRKVTQVWCVFFFCNAVISSGTLLLADKWWALYNGFIAYLLIGAIFAVEYLTRRKRILSASQASL